jgi:hypothetical protein
MSAYLFLLRCDDVTAVLIKIQVFWGDGMQNATRAVIVLKDLNLSSLLYHYIFRLNNFSLPYLSENKEKSIAILLK